MSRLCVFLRCTAIIVVSFLSGCSIYSVSGIESAPVEAIPEYTPVTPAPTAPQTAPPAPDPNASGAYRGLLDKADTAAQRGDYEQALALLERAQRIDPNSGEIYLVLAKTYRAKGDDSLAAATAERGLLYCDGKVQCDALRRYVN